MLSSLTSQLSAGVITSGFFADGRSPTFSAIKREIFHSLLQKLRPAITLFLAKAWFWPADREAIIPSLKASDPYSAITSIGLITLPLDLLIFWPFSSRTMPCKYTSLKGISPVQYIPSMIIREIHGNIRSCPVSITLLG